MSCVEWIETWTVCVAGAFVFERAITWLQARVCS
jgi:hypothetical protein